MKRKVVLMTNLLNLNDSQKEALDQNPNLEMIFKHYKELTVEDYQEAVAVIGNTKVETLKKFPNLQWVQLFSAGTNGYTDQDFPKGVQLTNATGSYGLAISEHLLGQTLMLQKKFHHYLDSQRLQEWHPQPGHIKSIYGSTFVIVGYGDIGTAYAKLVKAMGGYIIAVKRLIYGDEPYADEIYTVDQLDEVLGRGDVVANTLPGTLETYRLFDRSRIGKLKEGAIFLNVGRGSTVDLDALCDRLERGKLWGGSLDVTDPEPLPAEHRAWAIPNLLITPHISGNFFLEETFNRFLNIAKTNLENFAKEKPLMNVVDFETGYKKR